jgi:hypothetical protein
MKESYESEYRTADLPLAAYLSTMGMRFSGVDKNNPKLVRFIFQIGNQDVESLTALYLSGRGMVDAKYYYQQLKFLKDRIYNG